MLEALISNKTRVKLLIRFFMNPEMRAYLRELGREFQESSNAVRIELNRFEDAGLISSEKEGNRKYYQANRDYPLFQEMRQIAMKQFGLDQILDTVIDKLGRVRKVYLVGSLAKGQNTDIIDLVIVSNNINRAYLMELTEIAEKAIGRKIRCLLLESSETEIIPEPNMIIYESDAEDS